ncbi:putative pentatricopeptide repeat-containing protein At5g52630 [Phoenix dactylifera]|uniref:Pentatricopeptide repeat-containing protein At5g52630 n=1 Tax=Phoenix dactylifera TaxID=42345 RepID=A0A8B7CUR7_PHODC|nr:putative pentatricopeptide repeat-containing protein At5g52630 [Phoenix dactylifera]
MNASPSATPLSPNLEPCFQSDPLLPSRSLDNAHRLFDRMPRRDAFSWATLISAHARRGRDPSVALVLFGRMLAAGLPPDPYSLGAALRACSSAVLLRPARQSHALALKSSLASHPLVAAAIIDAYAECGHAASSALVFDSAPPSARSSRVLWTTLIAGLTRSGDTLGAMDRFRRMRTESVGPTPFTLPTVLAACASERALRFGRQVHGCAVRTGFASSPFVTSSLVNLYAKCSDLASARTVIESAESDDSVSWNALIVSCSRSGLYADVLSLFAEMRHRGLEMDEFTYPSALNSVASAGDAPNGSSLHGLILKAGFEAHLHVANALVDMYAKCGSLNCARGVFDLMPERDVVTWTALLAGLARHASHESALQLYSEMRELGIDSDEFITAGVLSSCAGLTLLELGRQVHANSIRGGFDSFLSVGNSLVTMYAKSGCMDDAWTVFDSMTWRDAITWTALIMGFAQNGRGRDSLRLYNEMTRTGVKPDYVTFIGLLFACSHAGLVEAGRAHFESMERVYRIVPGPEHYACMIDLLGRSGQIGEAAELLDRMETEPDATVWKALLAACRVHRNIGLAERAAMVLFELDPTDAVPYVLLSNMYSAAERWGDVARIRSLMKSRGVIKEPGRSWIEMGGVVHVFHVEDRGHARTGEIYWKVEEMLRRIKEEEGYVADTGFALHDVGDEGKEMGLAYHSEKLAVAFGLISMPRGAVIRVYKNLRVCGDCHTAIKMVSKVYGRSIVLRDSNCFHHVNEGICSCGDYW